MTLEYLYATFQALESIEDKVKFLQEMKELNLPYDINWDNTIKAWLAVAETGGGDLPIAL